MIADGITKKEYSTYVRNLVIMWKTKRTRKKIKLKKYANGKLTWKEQIKKRRWLPIIFAKLQKDRDTHIRMLLLNSFFLQKVRKIKNFWVWDLGTFTTKSTNWKKLKQPAALMYQQEQLKRWTSKMYPFCFKQSEERHCVPLCILTIRNLPFVWNHDFRNYINFAHHHHLAKLNLWKACVF